MIKKKVVLVGHFNVGKTSLIRRYVQNVFSEDYLVTIGVHILKKDIIVNNQEISLVLWDIEGKEDLKMIRESYLVGTSGFIFVIDPTRIDTFQNLVNDKNFLSKNYKKTPIITVANKSDLIDIEDFTEKMNKQNLTIDFFTSAKTGSNIDLVFEELAKKMLD